MLLPVVSVLTTLYNREIFISGCIDSVLKSTLYDWEMIIVDDCSTDQSVSMAREFEKRDSRIKVYVNPTNLGDYPNRNKAASLATGKYLKYLDADDTIYPHGLETFVKTMEMYPEAALGISQQVAEDTEPYPFRMDPHETYTREFLKRGVLGVGPTGTIIRRDVFEKLGGFTGTRFIGDKELWLKMAAMYPVVKISPGLIWWRKHEGQEYSIGQKTNFYLENNYFLAIQSLNSPACPLNWAEKNAAIDRLNKRFVRNTLRYAFLHSPWNGLRLMRKSGLSCSEIVKFAFFGKNVPANE